MISTKEYTNLPKPIVLRQLCKSIAVLDAIFSPDWEVRFHSYHGAWDTDEEVFEIQNDEGDHLLILFRPEGCVINGFCEEAAPQSKEELTKELPELFNEFMFDEPVNSIGTTFCMWITEGDSEWQTGNITDYKDGSEHVLQILDGSEQTYIKWANVFFEGDFRGSEINKETVHYIYKGLPLTKEIVLSLVDSVEDWPALAEELDEVGYPHSIEEVEI